MRKRTRTNNTKCFFFGALVINEFGISDSISRQCLFAETAVNRSNNNNAIFGHVRKFRTQRSPCLRININGELGKKTSLTFWNTVGKCRRTTSEREVRFVFGFSRSYARVAREFSVVGHSFFFPKYECNHDRNYSMAIKFVRFRGDVRHLSIVLEGPLSGHRGSPTVVGTTRGESRALDM